MKLKSIFWLTTALVLLTIVGLIPNIWILIALVAMLILWSTLTESFPEKTKIINKILGLAIFFTFVINFYAYFIEPRTPMTSEALRRGIVGADLEAALQINPQNLKTRVEIANHLQWLQDRVLGESYGRQLQNIRQRFDSNLISPEQAVQESQAILKKAKAEISPSRVSWRLALIGALLISSIFLPQSIPGRQIFTGLGVIILAGSLFLAIIPEIEDFFREQIAALKIPPTGNTEKGRPLTLNFESKTEKKKKEKKITQPPPGVIVPKPPGVSRVESTPISPLRFPGFMSQAMRQEIETLARHYADPQKFVNELIAGKTKGEKPTTYSGKPHWTITKDGEARQTHEISEPISGWKHRFSIGGRTVTIFYPEDDAFFAAIIAG